MHFHLPKPVHGWRAFVGEVGIIVIGVLIALGAEQLVEAAHWHEAGRIAVDAMNQDAAFERAALESRYDQQSCIDKRLNDLETVFARRDEGMPLRITRAVGRPFYSTGRAPSWEVAVADGSVAHLPFEVRSRFASAFGTYQLYERQMWEEKRAWQQLQMLNHAASLLPADWSQARQAYDLAKDFNMSFRVTLPDYIARFSRFPRAQTVGKSNPFQAALCKPMVERTTP
jgi:hypothetical protein